MKEYTVKTYDSGNVFWYILGTWSHHREEGPAIEYGNGSKEWWINGNRHREDGPAVMWAGGAKEWYLDGTIYTEEQYAVEMNRRNGSCEGKVIEVDGKKYKLTEA